MIAQTTSVVAGNVFQKMEARLCSASVEPYFVINIKKYLRDDEGEDKLHCIEPNRTEPTA